MWFLLWDNHDISIKRFSFVLEFTTKLIAYLIITRITTLYRFVNVSFSCCAKIKSVSCFKQTTTRINNVWFQFSWLLFKLTHGPDKTCHTFAITEKFCGLSRNLEQVSWLDYHNDIGWFTDFTVYIGSILHFAWHQ